MSLYCYIALILLLYWYFTKNFAYWKNRKVPFIKPLPIVGNMLNGVLMRLSFGELFYEFYQKTEEPVLGLFLFNKPCLLIRDLNIIKRIFISDFQYFCDRNILNNKRDDPISTNVLFNLKNPEWKEIRTKMSPVYSSAKIKAMSKLVEEAAVEMNNFLNDEVANRSVVDIKNVVIKYTVNAITSTAFGVDANCFKDENSQFYKSARLMFNWDNFLTAFRLRCYFLAHSLVKIFRMKLLHPTAIQFLESSFWEIMDERSVSKSHRNDLIDTLLKMKNDDDRFLDHDMLTSQGVMFFAAGFETSSSTLGFAMHELAFHPKIQTKLRLNIDKVFAKYGAINYDSIKEMEYLEMVVQETLRKYPIAAVLERKCNSRYRLPETSTEIEKDTPVFISLLGLHYNPEYFPDPEAFCPERFSAENKHKIPSFSYLPFGEGPRNCLGARIGKLIVKIGLAMVIHNFALKPCEEAQKKIQFNPRGLLLTPINGFNFEVTKIRNNEKDNTKI